MIKKKIPSDWEKKKKKKKKRDVSTDPSIGNDERGWVRKRGEGGEGEERFQVD